MAPFYEGERRIPIGEMVSRRTFPNSVIVKVQSDDVALVILKEGTAYVGDANFEKRKFLKKSVMTVTEDQHVQRKSISTNIEHPEVLWKAK